jgi:transposase
LILLEITIDELDAALAKEPSAWLCRRLVAVRNVLTGMSIEHAASKADVRPDTVRSWLRLAKNTGIDGLARNRLLERRQRNFSDLQHARDAMATALAKQPDLRLRKRLVAIDGIIAGLTIRQAANEAQVSRQRLGLWLAAIEERGIGGVLAEPSGQDVPAISLGVAELRQIARSEKDARVRKRLLALALVAEGKSSSDAAAVLGVSERSVENWRERFWSDGVDGLRDRTSSRWPFKLSQEQLREVEEIAITQCGLDYATLCEIVRERFGIHYTLPGIRRLITERLAGRLAPSKLPMVLIP